MTKRRKRHLKMVYLEEKNLKVCSLQAAHRPTANTQNRRTQFMTEEVHYILLYTTNSCLPQATSLGTLKLWASDSFWSTTIFVVHIPGPESAPESPEIIQLAAFTAQPFCLLFCQHVCSLHISHQVVLKRYTPLSSSIFDGLRRCLFIMQIHQYSCASAGLGADQRTRGILFFYFCEGGRYMEPLNQHTVIDKVYCQLYIFSDFLSRF